MSLSNSLPKKFCEKLKLDDRGQRGDMLSRYSEEKTPAFLMCQTGPEDFIE